MRNRLHRLVADAVFDRVNAGPSLVEFDPPTDTAPARMVRLDGIMQSETSLTLRAQFDGVGLEPRYFLVTIRELGAVVAVRP
jgi:hypothetical protein